MHTYTTLTDRKLSPCKNMQGEQVGSDRYIEIQNIDHFENLWGLMDNASITAINGNHIDRTGNKFEFKIIDSITHIQYKANISKMGSGTSIRLRVSKYADAIKMEPGQIITLCGKQNDTNYTLSIKTEWLYSYLFERNAESSKYILRSQSCTNLTSDQKFLNFIHHFGITATGNFVREGRDSFNYPTYNIPSCTSFYVGVPFEIQLELDCFEKSQLKERI